jgi:hypothetical protein
VAALAAYRRKRYGVRNLIPLMDPDTPLMTSGYRKEIEIRVTVKVALTDGWGGERWDIVSVTDDSTGEDFADISIYDLDAYSDFPGQIADAVRDAYFTGKLIDTDILYSLEVSIRDGGSEIGWSSRHYWGSHPCTLIT